jgi:hypothetical protein
MNPDAQTKVFLVSLVSVMGVATVAAFVKFFADDRKRVAAAQATERDLEQPYRDALGEFANIDKTQMTSDIEARMTAFQKQQWVELQALKGMHSQQQSVSLDLFGPMSAKDKLKRFAKMLGICILLLFAWLVAATVDDALGIKSHRGLPVSLVGAVLIYLVVVVVREKRNLR